MRRNSIEIVQNAFLPDLLESLKAEGIHLNSILSDYLIRKFELFKADNYIPSYIQNQILVTIERKVGANCLAAEMNQVFGVKNIGRFSNYMFNTPTLLKLLQLVIRYQKLMRTDYDMRLDISGPVTKYSAKINSAPSNSTQILEEIDISRIIDGMLTVAGDDFVPLEIGITSATSKYLEPIFPKGNYTVKTCQDRTWISFDTNYLFRKPPDIFEKKLTPNEPLLEGNISVMIELLLDSFRPGFVPKLGEVSSMIGISRRTIERGLEKEGTTYFTVKQKYQQRKSCELISNPDLSIREIAENLDFSNSQNFIRSFRSWYGMTPMQYRDRL